METILVAKNGDIVGYIIQKDRYMFILCTGKDEVRLNGKALKPTNRFGMRRPYMLDDGDIIEY